MRRNTVALLLAATLAAACARRSPVSEGIELAIPDRANAHVTLAADGDRVVAAWAATGKPGTDIYASVSGDGGVTFGRPVRVNDVEGDANSNGEQPPRIALKGNELNVIWVSKRGGVAGIRSALSTDGGATFSSTRTITPPGVTGARGWESVTFADDGTLHAAWLDGRPTSLASLASSGHGPPSPPPPPPPPSRAARATAGQAAPASARQAPVAAPDAVRPEPGPSGAHHHHTAPMKQNIYHAMWKGDETPVETEVAEDV